MRLVKKGENEQNAYYAWVPNQEYVSWKHLSNSKTIVVSKSVQNSLPTYIKNATTNCGCIANPIKHPRKQYVNLNGTTSGFSRQSYVGSLDKPGSENITSADCATLHQSGNRYLIDMSVPCDTSRCFVMKPATTVIDRNSYSPSLKEYLYKRCKSINQNTLTTPYTNQLISCSPPCPTNCHPVFVPSNTRYRVQGPLSSSARTAALRYCTQDGDDVEYSVSSNGRSALSARCYLPANAYSINQQKEDGMSAYTVGCRKAQCSIVRPGNKRYGTSLFVPGMA